MSAVVLTEGDLSEPDTLSQSPLIVGLTRARVHLEWVMARATEVFAFDYSL